MLIDVLTQLSAETGYNLVSDRAALVDLANVGAKELHAMLDCNAIKREVTLVIPSNAVVSLPSYIGDLKGMRMHTGEIPFSLNSISSPRYVTSTFEHLYKNWRDLGKSPVHTNPAVGQFTVENVEAMAGTKLLISAQSDKAARIQETLDLGINTQQTANIFGPKVFKIACLTNRTCNVVIKDVNGAEIAVLYNTDNKTSYRLVDVSKYCWTYDTASEESFIDILYKVPYTRLTEDTDDFFAGDDYDIAWFHIAASYYFNNFSETEKQALSKDHRVKAIAALHETKDGTERNIEKKVHFGRNKFYGLTKHAKVAVWSTTNVDNS
jgi:hypothetical protein